MNEMALVTLGNLSCKASSLLSLPRHALHLAYGAYTGQESPADVFERLGLSQLPRPRGPVLWFHTVSLGESAVALPLIFRCLLEYNEHVHVLLTTGAPEARALLASALPCRVTVQYVPMDNQVCMRLFLAHWRPQACILMESPAWPALVEACAAGNVRLALLNARMSSKSFMSWFNSSCKRALLGHMLDSFSLIVPQSDIDVGRFRILGATLTQMPGWCSDLKYAATLGTSVWHLWKPRPSRISALKRAVAGRPLWVAAYTAPGEEDAAAGVHVKLAGEWPALLTVIMPKAASRTTEIAAALKRDYTLNVVLWSQVVDAIAPAAAPAISSMQPASTSLGALKGTNSSTTAHSKVNSSSIPAIAGSSQHPADVMLAAEAAAATEQAAADAAVQLLKGVDVVLLDVASDLPLMYSVAEIAFAGSSLMEGGGGHNLAEAAVAGCAVLVGEHAGHFNTMADELNQAAVMAAEEASAAVNSSGPLEDPFRYSHAPANSSGGANEQPAAAAAAAVLGIDNEAAAAGEEPSPRDGSHWRGAIEQQPNGAGAAAGAAGMHAQQSQQHLQQHSGRPSTAPAMYHAPAMGGRNSTSGGGGQHAAAAADTSRTGPAGAGNASSLVPCAAPGPLAAAAAAVARPGSARDHFGRATAAAAAGGSSTGSNHAGRHSGNAWVNYAATLADCGAGDVDVGVLGVLGEEYSEPGGLLLQNSSLLSLPSSSGHTYDATTIGAPPPSAASSVFFGGLNTGEVTPASSISGGGAAAEQQQQQQGSYAQAYAQRMHSSNSRQQQQQQPGQQHHMHAPGVSHSSVGGRQGAQQQDETHSHQHQHPQQQLYMLGPPSCPLTPATPHPTPEDSAIAFGGRSPANATTSQEQQPQGFMNSALTNPAQLLSQQFAGDNTMTWGAGSRRRDTHGSGASAQQQHQQHNLPPAAAPTPGAGFFMSISGIAISEGQQQQQEAGAGDNPVHRPLSPVPPDSCSEAGTVSGSSAHPVASSGGNSAGAPPVRSRSHGGNSSSSMCWAPPGGSSWRGGSSGGEPMTAAGAAEGVVHEVPAAVTAAVQATDAIGSTDTGVRGMGRSPTICELVAAHDSCAAALVADGDTTEAASAADNSSSGGAQPVDLYPALAAAAAAASAVVEVIEGHGKTEIAKSGSMGWEDWAQQQQQQQSSHLDHLHPAGDVDGDSQCSSARTVNCNGSAAAAVGCGELNTSEDRSSDVLAAGDGSHSSSSSSGDRLPASTSAPVTTGNTPFAAAAAAGLSRLSSADSNSSNTGAWNAHSDARTVTTVPAVVAGSGDSVVPGALRSSTSGAGTASRLGDPARAAHYMDIQQQQQQQVPPLLLVRPVAVGSPGHDTAAHGTSHQQHLHQQGGPFSNSGSGVQSGSGSHSSQPGQHLHQQLQYGPPASGRVSVAGTPRGGSISWYNAAAGSGISLHNEGSSASLMEMDGRATPSSVYSTTSTATEFNATPLWQQQQQHHHHGYQQHSRVGPNSSSDGQHSGAAAGRRGSRPGGPPNNSDRPSTDGFWGRFGGLSGVTTPGALSSSGTPTPHWLDASQAGTPAAAAAPSGAPDPYIVPGTSYLRYRGEYILPATHLAYSPHGPAVWRVSGAGGLATAVSTLLREPLERRSRGHAAAQAAAKLASGLVSTVWHVVDDVVVAPALQDYVAQHGAPGRDNAVEAAAGRAPTRVLGHSASRS